MPPDEVASTVDIDTPCCFYDSTFGNDPTLLSLHIGPDSVRKIDFHIELLGKTRISFQMPRSPSEFGYEYTVAQYRAHLQNPDRRNLQSFSSFREKLWRDAISNPVLSQFFEECLAKVSTKGKYYCRVWTKEPSLQVVLSRDDGKIHFEQNGELSGIHFLTFLEDLFDHNEDPIRCGTD